MGAGNTEGVCGAWWVLATLWSPVGADNTLDVSGARWVLATLWSPMGPGNTVEPGGTRQHRHFTKVQQEPETLLLIDNNQRTGPAWPYLQPSSSTATLEGCVPRLLKPYLIPQTLVYIWKMASRWLQSGMLVVVGGGREGASHRTTSAVSPCIDYNTSTTGQVFAPFQPGGNVRPQYVLPLVCLLYRSV